MKSLYSIVKRGFSKVFPTLISGKSVPVESPDIEERYFENHIFLPQVSQLLNEGEKVVLRARGVSMRPFIEHNRDDLVFAHADKVEVGDVVLAEISQGVYVCHRVEKIESGMLTLRGDGNINGTEICPLDCVRGKVVQIVRLGKTWNLATSRIWKVYSRLWPALLPIRRFLLALNKIVLLHQVPDRIARNFRRETK